MERRIANLAKKICEEHFEISSNSGTNYLWFMYIAGTKKDTFKPFIFLAELHLLLYFKFMEQGQVDNCVNLLRSPDKENLFVASQVINFFRKERLKKLGKYNSKDPGIYADAVRDYDTKIVNTSLWNNVQKLETNE
tara:strand:- start:957 stop:1364 length:408 start_codon:yes stop_codon:yes gene_type:complete